MDYKKLTVETWKKLDDSGSLVSGYKSTWLALNDQKKSDFHIFRDELDQYHLAIESPKISKNEIEDPGVNGLQIGLVNYKFENGVINQFIDLKCNIAAYLEEFTEVVKEITQAVLEKGEQPLNAINQVVRNWISFWANQRKQILSEEEQIGLICELLTLSKLCKINPSNALNTWTGPLGEKHDFNFTDWNFEVKGTRKTGRIHTINSIDQLKPSNTKKLAFISFILATSNNENSVNLTSLVESIIKNHFQGKPDLNVRFNELIARIGYSPVHAMEYRKFNVEILESNIYEVIGDFPRLTSDMLIIPLNAGVSSIRYDISLKGMVGIDFNDINLGDYFY